MADNTLSNTARKNIAAVRDLAVEIRKGRSRIDRITDAISGFAGTPRFLVAQMVIIGFWVGGNFVLPTTNRLDPYPFEFLNFVLAVEAIFLSTVVLMAQNRQSREATEQAELHLQIGLLAEQETTKMLQMLRAIHARLGMSASAHDPELQEMIQTTQVEVIADELRRTREEVEGATSEPTEEAKGPPSDVKPA
ncbi:DUF1003 domain-containing protein [Frigoriglobus tundricola]|uniref:DUF1003 domain-containing protein n=1 Tax=Frigoriglobus tundricola TaxID=2774151 RepID=A0A6M5YJ52_9BACT|nr:DUF1003 domain-containing protein [Frigoriglobus tundricola]QJW93293.1 hypothetical protein FTUN_0799 [Frigoriglobus tundricola]